MKIEIHIRDTDKVGKRVGLKNVFVESCRVFKEPGDGLRLDNLAIPALGWYQTKSNEFLKVIKDAYYVQK